MEEQIKLLDCNESLTHNGFAQIKSLITKEQCIELMQFYERDVFRSTINMQRYRFGKGEYKYFNYQLPELIQSLRVQLYESLAPIANRWMEVLDIDMRYPSTHTAFIEICKDANQLRPTPLILRYGEGGY